MKISNDYKRIKFEFHLNYLADLARPSSDSTWASYYYDGLLRRTVTILEKEVALHNRKVKENVEKGYCG